MYWFWLNMPLAAAFFAAWVAIPIWLVFKHPDRGASPLSVLAPTCTHSGPARRTADRASRATQRAPGRRGLTVLVPCSIRSAAARLEP